MAISTKTIRQCDRCGNSEDQDPDNTEKWGSVGALLGGEKIISLEGGNQDFCPECMNALLTWYDSGSKYSEPSRPAEIRWKTKLLTASDMRSITDLISARFREIIIDQARPGTENIGSEQIIEGGLGRIDADARLLLVQILEELGLKHVKTEHNQARGPTASPAVPETAA